MHQGAIVENKLLGRALQYAKQLQQERDAHRLASRSFTAREKRLLRERQARAEAS